MSYEIINSDCLKAMQEMPDGCIDAIVTDPPYGLAFMGAKWDTFGRSKPYGNDSMAVRREKAKDYADTHKGAPRYGNGHGPGRLTAEEALAFQVAMTPVFEEALRVAKPGAHLLCFGGTRTFHRMTCAIEDAGWEIRDCIMWVTGQGFPKSMDVSKAIEKKHGADAAAQWDGWGTCLKPAWEPIIVARKPLEGTVAHNVMTYGTGAINIDGCRVPTSDKLGGGMRAGGADGVWDRPFMHDEKAQAEFVERKKANVAKSESLGRFPANLVHDGSQEVLELFPETGPSKKGKPRIGKSGKGWGMTHTGAEYDDMGTAARFFYCAKANKKDRGEGNDHPTVKPNALMRWLVRLVCPQGGIVLDPFMGSGSTGVACIQEGMEFVGIDEDKHYCDVADQRMRRELDGGIQRSMF